MPYTTTVTQLSSNEGTIEVKRCKVLFMKVHLSLTRDGITYNIQCVFTRGNDTGEENVSSHYLTSIMYVYYIVR